LLVEKMVYVDPEFEVPTVPDDEKYEGTELDSNVLDGKFIAKKCLLPQRNRLP
jgi:hypothetical protein